MPRFPSISRSRREVLVLVLLLLLGALLAAVPRPAVSSVLHDLFAGGNELLLDSFGWAFDLGADARENAELHRELAELRLALSDLEQTRLQNSRLRELLEFTAVRRPEILTGAEVIGRGDGRQAFAVTVSAGTADSVAYNQPVVTADGLVGRIDRAPGRHTAIVSLLNDPSNAVAAVIERSRVQGVFQFVGGQGRLLHVLQAADVQPGDRVKSSGLGGIYPEGLMIGSVVSVADDPDGVTQRIVVAPAAALDRLEEVFILRLGGAR